MPGSTRENGQNTAKRSIILAYSLRAPQSNERSRTTTIMLNGKRVIAVIPARGGSKSIPGKNIKQLHGKPLLAWSIKVAKKVRQIDRIIVSTDDAAISAVGREYGAEIYMRPPHLATDNALVIDALKDILQK